MLKAAICTNNALEPVRKLFQITASPLFDVAMRFYIGWFFFSSGLVKWNDFINGNFSNVVEKFDSWYPVVIGGTKLDPTFAAYAGMLGELILPVLLFAGLFGRFAAFGLLIMATMITFFTESTMFFEGPVFFESVVMFVITGMLFIKGPGFISLDHILVSALRGRSAAMPDFKTQIGLEEPESDLPGHEASGRVVRALATGFWYTLFALAILHVLAGLLTFIPGLDLSAGMITNMFTAKMPETALTGYVLSIIYAYIAGTLYAVTSLKMDVVYTLRKSAIWAFSAALIFMVLYALFV